MGHSAGLRAGTRYAFSRKFKQKGMIKLSTYLREYRYAKRKEKKRERVQELSRGPPLPPSPAMIMGNLSEKDIWRKKKEKKIGKRI